MYCTNIYSLLNNLKYYIKKYCLYSIYLISFKVFSSISNVNGSIIYINAIMCLSIFLTIIGQVYYLELNKK